MLRTLSLVTSFILTAASLLSAPVRAPEVTFDTDPIGGYKGDVVLIYNPNTSPQSALSTGNMQGVIQASNPHPRSDLPGMLDVDQQVKHHSGLFPPSGGISPQASYQVGSRQSFYVDPYYSANGQYLLTFECLAVGEYCCVWSLDPGGPNGPSLGEIDPSLAQSLANEFDLCCPQLLSVFGQESWPRWFSSSKLNILCYNISDGWQPAGGSFIGGYFSADTCLNSSAPIINIDTVPTIWQGHGEPSLEVARRVLVHEYAHLLTFAATGGTEDWIEEVIASAAEEICYPGSCIVPRVPCYDNMDGASMYEWGALFGAADALYSRGALFGQYLYTRFGNEVFGSIIANIANGSGVVSAVYFATGETLANLMLDFNLAVVINDISADGGKYGFATQPGYDPALYGIDDPYSALSPRLFTGPSCVIYGGGAIIVKPKYSAYYPPSDASSGLRYVGVKITYPSYTVDFYGLDGALLSSQTVGEGQPAQPPQPPYEPGYTFVKWSCEISCIQGDTSVYALYALNECILRFDADCSGVVNFADAAHICLYLEGMYLPQNNAFYLNADSDLNGRIEMTDVSALYLILCGEFTL